MGVYWPYGGADHPRSRGVYQYETVAVTPTQGSSPLARGLHHAVRGRTEGLRIIPARAGFTVCQADDGGASWDHPRSRGVYAARTRPHSRRTGSSPLARGLLARGPQGAFGPGIIPARAGFTSPAQGPGCAQGDHPRSRGVYVFAVNNNEYKTGSSPLARGLLCGGHAGQRPHGIIPARAGFTPSGRLARRSAGDHPRSRGVYHTPSARKFAADGSPPLARGLRPGRVSP